MILTVPSYVIPGTYLENVQFLAGTKSGAGKDLESNITKQAVQGIELLFFYYDDGVRKLFKQEQEKIEAFRDRFVFTLHLPDTVLPEHREIVEMTQHMVHHYIVHPPRNKTDTANAADIAAIKGDNKQNALSGNGKETSSPEQFLPAWIEEFGNRFLLENTQSDRFYDVFNKIPAIPVCCDIGHLLLEGIEPASFLELHKHNIREIHLHGVRDGKDHTDFDCKAQWLDGAVPFFREFEGVINLEVFSFDKVRNIVDALNTRQVFNYK